jgi:hypothetical protein
MSEWPMTEEQKADMKAYLAECRRESDLANKRRAKALAEYLEKFEQPVYRKGTLYNEAEGERPAIFEVIRSPQVVDNDCNYASWTNLDGELIRGHCVAVWVREGLSVVGGCDCWSGEERVYYVYFDDKGEFHHEMVVDLNAIRETLAHRHSQDNPDLESKATWLEVKGFILDDTGDPNPPQLNLTTPAA